MDTTFITINNHKYEYGFRSWSDVKRFQQSVKGDIYVLRHNFGKLKQWEADFLNEMPSLKGSIILNQDREDSYPTRWYKHCVEYMIAVRYK